MAQTALQELKQWVLDTPPSTRYACLEEKINQLIKRERQQIMDAYNQGYREGEIDGVDNGRNLPLDVSEYEDAENYFTNTFTK